MHGNRRLQHESLESRRLLAASCLPADPVENGDALKVIDGGQVTAGEQVIDGTIRSELIAPFRDFFLSHGPDLIQEQGNRLFVVDQQPFAQEGGNLFVFERADDGTLATIAEVTLEFPVDRMIVNGDQVLLFGNDFHWRILANHTAGGTPEYSATAAADLARPESPTTIVVTVNLAAEVEVIRQEFEGLYHEVHHEGDRIVMVSSVGGDVLIAIYPPPLVSGLLRTFDITNGGLQPVGSTEIPLFGTTSVHEQDFYSATTTYPEIYYLVPPGEGDPIAAGVEAIRPPDHPQLPVVSVSKFLLGDDVIREVSSLDLGPGYLMNFEVAADGQTAIVVRSEFLGVGPATVVELLDLSGEQVRVFESIRLSEINGHALVIGPDYVVLRNYDENALVVIDVNQSIDLAAENRIRRVEIPRELHLHYEFLHVSEDRLVLRANRFPAPDDGVETNHDGLTIIAPRPHETILLTVSISEARVIADTPLPIGSAAVHGQRFVLIDAETERFGFIAGESTATDFRPRFLFGQLTDSGEFEIDGEIPVGRWLEVDANADRLIARESDRLLQYDWQNTAEPIETPLGEPDPLPIIEAVNDQYRLNANGEDHLLNVLANDVIHHFEIAPTAEIVELIGAPEGAEIVHGNMVRIPAAALEGVETIRFEYVISNGEQRSSAVVEINVQLLISEDRVRELVDAIRQRAAEDFGVSIDDVEITFVEKIFNEPLPIILPEDPNERDLSPGVLVTLTVPDATAMYAASLEGEVIQVFASRREFLVELGLRAVDKNGATLERITEGDNFWLEFNAKDLRELGGGVYAAFFDLVVPTEHLVITGQVEDGPGFISLPGSELGEGEIDELGAFSNQFEPPGNERQQILRIGVQAVSPGEFTLNLDPADQHGTEVLLRGLDTEVPEHNVRYTSLTLNVVEAPAGDPLDADGNGFLSASDALVVINFLGRYGATSLENLVEQVRAASGEGEQMTDQELADMRRLDTNGSGDITALDALVVVNGLQRQTIADEMAAGEQVSFAITSMIEDDDEDDDEEEV